MFQMNLVAMLGGILFFLLYLCIRKDDNASKRFPVKIIFFAALLLRITAAAVSQGFGSDTACFAAWADRIFQTGPAGFYSADMFTDYPPGYMYLLYPVGALRSILQLPYYSPLHLIGLKLPAILCDMLCSVLLYREAGRKLTGNLPLILTACYLFNPAVILNSAVWGQVDSVFTLCILCMILMLTRGLTIPSYFCFCIGILVKPQALLFAPVLLSGMLDEIIFHDFNLRKLLKNLMGGLASLLMLFLLCLPFGITNVWNQYFSTIGSYPYAAVNAYNFWGFLGKNWTRQTDCFLGISYQTYGSVFLALSIVFVLYFGIRHRSDREKYPFMGAFLMLYIFTFSVRMHERYLYPAMLLLLLACVYKPSRKLYGTYCLMSILHFYNIANILFFYDPANYDRKAPIIILISGATVLLACHMLLLTGYLYSNRNSSSRRISFLWKYSEAEDDLYHSDIATLEPVSSRPRPHFTRKDAICLISITVLYSLFAFHDLGDTTAPETTMELAENDSLYLDFGDKQPASLTYYIAPWHNRTFLLQGFQAATGQYDALPDIVLENVFTWQTVSLTQGYSQLNMTLKDNQASLIELCFTDADGSQLLPVNASDYPTLFDEQELMPERSSFRNSMYFDEIYHARTAYEFLHGLSSYENTHPPLGKILIALGVKMFGMNPFGWRIIGTLFGVAMLPVLYLFALRIFRSTAVSALTCFLFAFDFMHFTQTRIATIDVYITFFVILMYYFMYQYCELSFYDTSLSRTWIPLGACGIVMGLGIASKWTGIYAGIGLAVIFFIQLYKRFAEYRYAKKCPSGTSNGIPHQKIIRSFLPNTGKTILFCILFFVLIPAAIYLLSYLPFRDYENRGLIGRMLHNQISMFQYHSGLESTHYFASPWYEWPIIKKPIWYYSGVLSESLREGISAFGNPLVWWVGIAAALYNLYLAVWKKDSLSRFLIVGYLAQYFPWFFVTRTTFIYHYFPSVVFVVLLIAQAIKTLTRRLSSRAYYSVLITYGLLCFILFLMFYPVLSGQPVSAEYVDRFLRWSSQWVLVAK